METGNRRVTVVDFPHLFHLKRVHDESFIEGVERKAAVKIFPVFI